MKLKNIFLEVILDEQLISHATYAMILGDRRFPQKT